MLIFGKIIGAYLIQKLLSIKMVGVFILLLSIITTIAAVTENHYILLLIMSFHGIFREYSSIYLETYIVKKSPYEMRGRVKSLSEILGNVFLIMSMTSAIYIEQYFSGVGLLIFFGILFSICFLTWLMFYIKNNKLEIINIATVN